MVILSQLHEQGDKDAKAKIEQYVTVYDPKALYKNLKQQISNIKRGRRFTDVELSAAATPHRATPLSLPIR